MPRQTLSFLRRRFEEVGIDPVKKFGQNFLIDLNLLDLLADTAQLGPDDVVLEVGTGTGSLTGVMAERAAHVVTVEIDPRMHQLASEELIDRPNVTLLHMDALRNKNHLSDDVLNVVRAKLAETPHARFKLAANLPYCVATPVMSNLMLWDTPPVSMTVTIQKELADRIVAEPGKKDYSALSIWCQSLYRAEIVRVLAPSVFWPRPKVDSAILQLTYEPEPAARIADLTFFHDFTRQLFLYRRKMLRGVLVNVLKGKLDKPGVDALIADLGYAEQTRAEELPVEEHIRLSDAIRARLAAVA
ncbi:MAG: 16S rRNA (adenine(1518)-N(6)/adenine(1519)-N(6))-dimethyltransferase RsmA [Pirellulales bacterium]